MMNKKQTSFRHLGKYVFILPVLVLSLLAFNASKTYEIKSTFLEKNNLNNQQALQKDTLKDEQPIYYVDEKIQPANIIKRLDQSAIASIEVLKDKKAIELVGQKGKNGVIRITTKSGNLSKSLKSKSEQISEENNKSNVEVIVKGFAKKPSATDNQTVISVTKGQPSVVLSDKIDDNVLIYIDGKKANKQTLQKINTDDIEQISILKDEKALKTYGAEAKNGVIEVTLKKHEK